MKPSYVHLFKPCLLLSCVSLFSLNARATTIALETFDNDTAGFVRNTTSSDVVHIAVGGNPGGFIAARKDLSPPVFDIGALTTRPEFTGDYAAAGVNRVAVDLNFLTANIDAAWVRFRPDVFTNGWVHPLTAAFPVNAWNSYSVAFDPTWSDLDARANGWLTDSEINPLANPSPAFAAVMSSVEFAEVRIASVGSTLVGIDNFSLQATTSVPDSSSLTIEGLAILSVLLMGRRPLVSRPS